MRRLYATHGVADRGWTWEDLIRTASETAGTDMAGFFTNYVAGLEPLPLEAQLQRLGMRLTGQTYAAEMYVAPDLNASSDQRARRTAYFRPGSPRR
jgi:predicted metalloprotease with PDZ domain